MADPGEGPLPPPLIFWPNWEPKGRKKHFLRPGPIPLIAGSGWPPRPPSPYLKVCIRHCIVTKYLDIKERIYMVMSFLPGEGLKVVESGFSGVGCEQQTYFRLSLLSLGRAISRVAFFVSNTYFHCTKNLICTKCFPFGGHCDFRHFQTVQLFHE